MVLEIGKKYINEFYGGDLTAAVKEKDGILWTNEKISGAFNFGAGTKKHFNNYMKNNKNFCYFVEV